MKMNYFQQDNYIDLSPEESAKVTAAEIPWVGESDGGLRNGAEEYASVKWA
jgi:hypothetical protein